MPKEAHTIAFSAIHRVAKIDESLKLERDAVLYLREIAESTIIDNVIAAMQFMKYRKGTMLKLSDIKAAEAAYSNFKKTSLPPE